MNCKDKMDSEALTYTGLYTQTDNNFIYPFKSA